MVEATDQEAKQTTPRSKSRSAMCSDTILRDIMSQIISSIANCCETDFVVKDSMTSQRKGFSCRSCDALTEGGRSTKGNMGRKALRKVYSCSSASLSGTSHASTS